MLPAKLHAEVDEAAKQQGLTRTDYIIAALEARLSGVMIMPPKSVDIIETHTQLSDERIQEHIQTAALTERINGLQALIESKNETIEALKATRLGFWARLFGGGRKKE